MYLCNWWRLTKRRVHEREVELAFSGQRVAAEGHGDLLHRDLEAGRRERLGPSRRRAEARDRSREGQFGSFRDQFGAVRPRGGNGLSHGEGLRAVRAGPTLRRRRRRLLHLSHGPGGHRGRTEIGQLSKNNNIMMQTLAATTDSTGAAVAGTGQSTRRAARTRSRGAPAAYRPQ